MAESLRLLRSAVGVAVAVAAFARRDEVALAGEASEAVDASVERAPVVEEEPAAGL